MLRLFKFWLTVRRARRELEAIARQYCASAKADSFRGATPKHFSFRIAVLTDRERDRMRGEPRLYQQLSGALLRVVYPADAVPFVHFRISPRRLLTATTAAVGLKRAKCRDADIVDAIRRLRSRSFPRYLSAIGI